MTEEKKSRWEYTAIAEYMYKRLGYPLNDMPWEWYDTLKVTVDGVIDMVCQMEEGDFPGLADFTGRTENDLWEKDKEITALKEEIVKLKKSAKRKRNAIS